MSVLRETWWLLQKEFLLEWRNKFALSGILLYVFSTIFIVYLAFFNVDPRTWNALFWIIVSFAAVNAAVKSFAQENSQRQLYYYTLVNPIAVILSKIVYNIGLLFVISVLTWLGFGFVADNPVKDVPQFILVIFLGSLGFAIAFTFISAISAKANNNATLMAIMSFPVIIPVLLTLIKLSANALRILQDTSVDTDIMILVSINMLLLGMALLLYPYLWRG